MKIKDSSPLKKYKVTGFCFVLLIILALTSCEKNTTNEENPESDFKVYDALIYTGKPDLRDFGITPLKLIYTNAFWKTGENMEYPIERNVRFYTKTMATYNNPVVIDIEHWDLAGTDEVVSGNIKKMIDVIEWCKDERPEAKFGFYAELPQRQYWPAIQGGAAYEDWIKDNERLKELAAHVDAVFPSLYTFYNDPVGWEKYAIENLTEARKYGKPMYPFLWPIYHQSNATLGGTHIDGLFWRKQLDICKQYADGVVIWGGWKVNWDPNLEWWKETTNFIETLK